MSIETRLDDVPFLTSAQMVEVDRLMIEDFRIELIQMMENAGRNLAYLARRRFLDGDPVGRRVTVLAGTGGNGGGALVAARRLHNWGAAVRVCLSRGPEQFTQVPRHQLDVLTRSRSTTSHRPQSSSTGSSATAYGVPPVAWRPT